MHLNPYQLVILHFGSRYWQIFCAELSEIIGTQAIEDIVIGSVLGPSSQRANECRIASLLAGIPETVPVFTVNRYVVRHRSRLLDGAPAWPGDMLSSRLSLHSSGPLAPLSWSCMSVCQHSCPLSSQPINSVCAACTHARPWFFSSGRADATAIRLTGNVHPACKQWPLLPLLSGQASTPLGLLVELNP